MKLTDADWAYVRKHYGNDKAFQKDRKQIEKAVEKTVYYRYRDDDVESKAIPLTRAGVIRLLGRETWLGGIVRSSFHGTSVREDDKGRTIFFNSLSLFKD